MSEKQDSVLNSWKEIADYLDRDVRTLRRWEKKKGLPVHRVPGGKRPAVFAYSKEIDHWRRGVGVEALNDEGAQQSSRRLRVAFYRIAGSFLVIVLMGAAAVVLVKNMTGSANIGSPVTAQITVEANRLAVHNNVEQELWSYSFTEPLQPLNPGQEARRIYVGDLTGDQSPEVIAFVHFANRPGGAGGSSLGRLYCFSSTGQVLWTFEPDQRLQFAGREFSPPWQFKCLTVFETAEEKRIAVAVAHDTWWPSLLLVLDGRGRLRGQFVNSGWIVSLSHLQVPSGNFLLAGGYSNAHQSGMLAVLDAGRVAGSSPENAGSQYQCSNCSREQPLRYFVFPRSELNAFTPTQKPRVEEIRIHQGTFEAHTLEHLNGVEGVYEFTSDFELKAAGFSDPHRGLHRELEAAGKITHAYDQCPERDGPGVVRAWDPARGWHELMPSLQVSGGPLRLPRRFQVASDP